MSTVSPPLECDNCGNQLKPHPDMDGAYYCPDCTPADFDHGEEDDYDFVV